MRKMLILMFILISLAFCISSVSAVSPDDHISGNISVIDCDLTYGFSNSQLSTDYYYTSPDGGDDAYYYLVSANGEIKLNVSNITINELDDVNGDFQDYVDKNFKNDLKTALDEGEDFDGYLDIGVDLAASLGPSDVTMDSASLDGDILTIKFNGTPITKYDQKSGLSDDWDSKNAYMYIFLDNDSVHYNFNGYLDNVAKVHI